MIRNGLRMAIRNMRRHKGYAIVNVAGLTVGLAAACLILSWVRHELSFDRFHEHAPDIYRVVVADQRQAGLDVHPWLPFPVGRTLAEQHPEVVAYTRLLPDDFMIRHRDQVHSEPAGLFVDRSFFSIFSFPFRRGDGAKALADPSSIVVTDAMATKYFGEEDPMGRTLTLSDRADFTVTGVVHIPLNSEFQYDYFLTFDAFPRFGADLTALEANWQANNYPTYIQLARGCSPRLLEPGIAGLLSSHYPDRKRVLKLQPLADVHLYHPDGTAAQVRYVWGFALVAGLVLFMACVNFANLATAGFERRAREVGIRKTLGGTSGQLAGQFLVEAMLCAGIAFVLALALLATVRPHVQILTGTPGILDHFDGKLILGLLAVTALAGLAAGIYPALVLSQYPPMGALRRPRAPGRGIQLRRGLVVFQFTASTLLLICTLAVVAQLRYIREKDIGLNRNNLVCIQMHGASRDRVATLRPELLRHADILHVTACRMLPHQIFVSSDSLTWAGRPPGRELVVAFASVDADYLATFGMNLVRGRNFSATSPADERNFIINEEAVRQMGVPDPVGQRLVWMGEAGTVVGVVRNFNHRPLTDPILPLVLTPRAVGGKRGLLVVRLRPGDSAAALAHIRRVWNRINPGFACEFSYFDEAYDRQYGRERQTGVLLGGFSLLAVMLCVMGLAGLSAYLVAERRKEIAIRKVIGASTTGIVVLLARSFVRWVVVANLVAWPLGFFLAHRWLQGYAYRTELNGWMFVVAGGASLLTVFLAVGWQTCRAALEDPVRALQHE
jgi:hypothetical protein